MAIALITSSVVPQAAPLTPALASVAGPAQYLVAVRESLADQPVVELDAALLASEQFLSMLAPIAADMVDG